MPIPTILLNQKKEEDICNPNPMITKSSHSLNTFGGEQFNFGNAEVIILGKPKNRIDEYEKRAELVSILKEKKIDTVRVPDTSTFNGALCDPNDFQKEIVIDGIKIINGIQTEGFIIPKGSAAAFYSADCPTVICTNNDLVLAFHAGLSSLFDRLNVTIGTPPRNYASVVDSLKQYLIEHEINPKSLEVLVVCGIGMKSFRYYVNDLKWKVTNLKIFDYFVKKHGKDAVPFGTQKGNLNLFGIIKEQLIRIGFDPEKIKSDDRDTYSDTALHSHYRSKELKEEGLERNLVLIKNE